MSLVLTPRQAQILAPREEEGEEGQVTIFDVMFSMMILMMILMPLMFMPMLFILPMINMFKAISKTLTA
mgnify:CR=1 FL=1